MNDISIVIPAYNESKRIEDVITSLPDQSEVIVIDDCSKDNTGEIAEQNGAKVFRNKENKGYIYSLRKGLQKANNEIIVTIDADGEHKPEDIRKITQPIKNGEKDLVFGVRNEIPRISERILNEIARLKVDVKDTGTGFRALEKDLANNLNLNTACTCGSFALEAEKQGAAIGGVKSTTKDIDKPRGIAWKHFKQFFYVIKLLISN